MRSSAVPPSVPVVVPLGGPWEVRKVGTEAWLPVAVPGCWEDAGLASDDPGPVDYRTVIRVPQTATGERIWLRFGAVSYACEVFVDEQLVAQHVGLWDGFEVEITPSAWTASRGTVALRVRAEKPASLTAGPDSPAVPGNYPTRETLAGFLPYVWGHVHGGIWQPVELVVTGPSRLLDATAWGTPDGVVTVEAELDVASEVSVVIVDPGGATVAKTLVEKAERLHIELVVPDPRPWSPEQPNRYTVRLCSDGDERQLVIGLRRLRADGPHLMLNERPLFPRMALSWGWYPDVRHCDPGPERVRRDLVRLRELGFNGVKLCLWFPPRYFFDLADELGMLLWVELPMWLPHPTPHFRGQLEIEAERLVRAARDHPSVVLYTLGCELGAAIGEDILAPLYDRVEELTRDALVRDNSGSGEAYGGLLDEHADFYDHHFYCELQHFGETLDYFAPRWRESKPWLFGEFCDLDTFRDPRRLGATEADRPWWVSADPRINPQGARWQFDVHEHEAELRSNGYWERGDELEWISHQQALLHRKFTLEAVRARDDTTGYVITGERDTPISMAGVIDDFDELKCDPPAFRQFNADSVLVLGWDRRRAWVAGGDRPARSDPWCHRAGSVVRAHLVLAHHGCGSGVGSVRWSVEFDGESPFVEGESADVSIAEGEVRALGIAHFTAPEVDRPRRIVLSATARVGDVETANAWPFWVFPSDPWSDVEPVRLVDPGDRLSGLASMGCRIDDAADVLVATRWTPDVELWLDAGGSAVVLADEASDLPFRVSPAPFWREAVKVLERHDAWGDFPNQGWVDLQFFGMAPDLAIDLGEHVGRPILRRVDARTATVLDYATDLSWGAGRLIVSTLRMDGGRGDQPYGIGRAPAASYLLSRWVDWLSSERVSRG